MPPWTDHGGSMAAMCGKDCVVIATDYHPGSHQTELPDSGFKKVFKVNSRTFLGLTGLQMDILAVRDRAMNRHNQSELSQCREMSPKEFSMVLSNLLSKQRSKPYYVEPVVAGLEPDLEAGTLKPYICYMDWIGCRKETQNFLVAGTCAAQLTGMCSTLWKPDLSPDELFEVISTALHRGLARHPTTRLGTSLLVYLIAEDTITERLVNFD
ncbi:hypothetical protein KR038_009599 [Drosophila bunnanda]|nr:hypothetical protein KR038_009599 [Drosophila bunnanda]